MLMTFATTRRVQAPHRIGREYRRRMTPANPRPETIPSRAHISWTAAMSGKEKSAVQRGA